MTMPDYNPNDWNAVVAAIMTRLAQGDEIMKNLTAALGNLPCNHHQGILNTLIEDKNRRDKAAEDKTKTSRAKRVGIAVGLTVLGVSLILDFIINVAQWIGTHGLPHL